MIFRAEIHPFRCVFPRGKQGCEEGSDVFQTPGARPLAGLAAKGQGCGLQLRLVLRRLGPAGGEARRRPRRGHIRARAVLRGGQDGGRLPLFAPRALHQRRGRGRRVPGLAAARPGRPAERLVHREKDSEAKLQAHLFHVSPAYLEAERHRPSLGWTGTGAVTVTPATTDGTKFYIARLTDYTSTNTVAYRLRVGLSSMGMLRCRRGRRNWC